jgi:energy-coupling factor transporter ATP-binding protein EcfA2
MNLAKTADNPFERFLDSIANEVMSASAPKITLLIGKNGTGKSFVLKRILEKSVARNVKTLAVSFGVADRFPFSLVGPYEYIGTRTIANAVYVNSIDSKIFDAIVSCWHDEHFQARLSHICELLEIPCDFMVHATLGIQESGQDFTDFLMKSSVRRVVLDREMWRPLGPGRSYTAEQRQQFAVDLERKFKVSVRDVQEMIDHLLGIMWFDGPSSGRAKKWVTGSVPIDELTALNNTGGLIPVLRFLGVLRDFSLTIGRTIGADHLSSGQKNILFTLVQMSRHVTPDALVLIDEPEISLHPDWQSRYLSFLGRVFGDVPCKIVIATHSPFFSISEDAESANIFSLRRTLSGHQWQRIESLSGVPVDVAAVDGFGVRYPSSPHLEQLLLRAVNELGKAVPDPKITAMLCERLTPLVRDPFDPLQVIVDKLVQVGAES